MTADVPSPEVAPPVVEESLLADVVCRDQDSASFRIARWSARRLSGKGIINPEGLWLFSGEGSDGQGMRPWSVVLKKLTSFAPETPPGAFWYWKREVLLAQSGLTERLPGPVRAPRFYHTEETATGAMLWMEFVRDRRPAEWGIEDYAFAARQLGLWNGACFLEMKLPDDPWLCRNPYPGWLSMVDPKTCWDFPLNKRIPAPLRARHECLWAEREALFQALTDLPQVFCHFDAQRRNSFISRDRTDHDQLVLADWAICGVLCLGAELNALVPMSCFLNEWQPSAVKELDATGFKNYVQGLHDAGWKGNEDQVRLAYTGTVAAYCGCAFPGLTSVWCAPENAAAARQQFGASGEELLLKWMPLYYFTLGYADEARSLIKRLGVKGG